MILPKILQDLSINKVLKDLNINVGDLTDKVVDKYEEIVTEMGHVNIIVAGKTGIGKSTLLNAVFRENLEQTGIGAPVTQTIRKRSKEGYPLNLFDTIGLELDPKKQKQAVNEIQKTIKDARDSGDDDRFIHCIWYCVDGSSTRFEPAEEAFVEQLSSDAKSMGVPVIIVLTQSFVKERAEALKAHIEGLNLNVVKIFCVLAEDIRISDTVIKAFGVEELVEYTMGILPKSKQQAFINASKSLKLKRMKAHGIVSAAAAVAFGIGAVPIPFKDAPLLMAEQVGMIAGITATYGLSVDKSKMAVIYSSFIGTALTTGLGRLITSNLLNFSPGIGWAINGTTAAALTTSFGEAYIYFMDQIATGKIDVDHLDTKKLNQIVKGILKKEVKLQS